MHSFQKRTALERKNLFHHQRHIPDNKLFPPSLNGKSLPILSSLKVRLISTNVSIFLNFVCD